MIWYIQDGVMLQLQYGQKDSFKLFEEVSPPSHAAGDMDSDSSNQTHQKKNTPSNGHNNLFLANLFTGDVLIFCRVKSFC